jgi:PPM family protein phosphatase
LALRIVEEAGLTDVGRQRHTNEDRFYESPPLFAVADGMGGARAGEVASRIAVEEFDQPRDGQNSAEEQLAAIARAANRKIYELAQSDESHAGMGTTLTAVMVGDNDISIGHVGDSRAYRFRDDELERLTQDHSLVEELVRQGKLTPEGAESHPQRSIITRALGPEPDVEVETFTYPGKPGDVYLLCSDGLTGMVTEDRVAQILRGRSSLEQAAKTLVGAANERGGKDNITVVLFKLGEEGSQPAESDTLSGAEKVPTTVEATPADGEPGGDTVVLPPREAGEARVAAAAPPRAAPPARRPAPVAPRPRGRRAILAGLVVAVVIAAAAVGVYVASRQFYFVGTDDVGLVTLYRGLPYELPFGIKLYSTQYESAVPALSLPTRQRDHVLDHRLRARGDAVDLVRQLERTRG